MKKFSSLFVAFVLITSSLPSMALAVAELPGGYGGGGDPVSCDLVATPDTIDVGGGTLLTWSLSSNVTNAYLTPKGTNSWMQNVPLDGSWWISGIIDTRSYTLHVEGAEGQTASCDALITVEAAPVVVPPSCDMEALPSTIAPNGATTLAWTSSDNTVSAVLHPTGTFSWSQDVPVDGSWYLAGITDSRSYSLTVTNSEGDTYTCDAPIEVVVPEPTTPTCTITAVPDTIAPNGATTLVWNSSSNVVSGKLHPTGSEDYFVDVTASGSWWISGITDSRSYSVTVYNGDGGSATCDAPITVADPS